MQNHQLSCWVPVWKTRLEFKDMNGDIQILDIKNDHFYNIQDVVKILLMKGILSAY